MDERERQHFDKSWRFVLIAVLIAVFIYDMLNLSLDNYRSVTTIIWPVFAGTRYLYDYIVNKKTSSLVVCIFGAICYVLQMALFIMNRFDL
ncbi:MAG: hypothetical protein IJY33_06385 [Oscillospiraceae bacterium]|nr:hypothetical protein [Oscillospiraceae bacterium]